LIYEQGFLFGRQRNSRLDMRNKEKSPPNTQRPYIFLLFFSLGIAFWLRWRFLQAANPYPDEFVTLLAMDMIRQKGAPILPSGLFYDHGLLYSYLAALASFFGESVLWGGRLTSLFFGLATLVLTYDFGRRWLSPAAGFLAAMGLSLTPVAIQWSGRVRMYALLQFLVLLTLWLMLEGLYHHRLKASWLAVGAYLGAMLTHFVAVPLLPPLGLAEIVTFRLKTKHWPIDRTFLLRGIAVGVAVAGAFLVKRAGQPKGIEPLASVNPAGGVWQVFQIYGDFSPNLSQSWAAISPFFLEPPVAVYSLFALVVVSGFIISVVGGIRGADSQRLAVGFLTIVLAVTTLEMLFLVAPDRRDDKYLFMLLPVLLLLGAQGMTLVWQWGAGRIPLWIGAIALFVVIGFYSRSQIIDLLANPGEDYEAAFNYVAEHWQPGDAVLTGTPTAAYYYLGRNDYYAVQLGGGYDYRLLPGPNGQVDRWLGSPRINTLADLNAIFTQGRVWLVLERWGLLSEYYEPFFGQNILAQTEFVREDNGVIVLKSLPDPKLLPEAPAVPADAALAGTEGDPGQLKLLGYTQEGERLTLYWQVQTPLVFDYTVFVNVQNDAGHTVRQTDHRPLGSIYPTTLWPPGQIIRETSRLDLSPGTYRLRVGMYRLETGERLWVPADETMQNMVYLGLVEIR
jgi:4-amino-4-deoxy-L-arabinose transferase-like glycosyltransferase